MAARTRSSRAKGRRERETSALTSLVDVETDEAGGADVVQFSEGGARLLLNPARRREGGGRYGVPSASPARESGDERAGSEAVPFPLLLGSKDD